MRIERKPSSVPSFAPWIVFWLSAYNNACKEPAPRTIVVLDASSQNHASATTSTADAAASRPKPSVDAVVRVHATDYHGIHPMGKGLSGERLYVVGGLRVEVASTGVKLAEQEIASTISYVADVPGGWVFAALDGSVFFSQTFLGPLVHRGDVPTALVEETPKRMHGRLAVGATGVDGSVWTTDGTRDIAPVPVLLESASYEHVRFLDANHGALVDASGMLWMTRDGARTWTHPQGVPNITTIQQSDDRTYYVVRPWGTGSGSGALTKLTPDGQIVAVQPPITLSDRLPGLEWPTEQWDDDRKKVEPVLDARLGKTPEVYEAQATLRVVGNTPGGTPAQDTQVQDCAMYTWGTSLARVCVLPSPDPRTETSLELSARPHTLFVQDATGWHARGTGLPQREQLVFVRRATDPLWAWTSGCPTDNAGNAQVCFVSASGTAGRFTTGKQGLTVAGAVGTQVFVRSTTAPIEIASVDVTSGATREIALALKLTDWVVASTPFSADTAWSGVVKVADASGKTSRVILRLNTSGSATTQSVPDDATDVAFSDGVRGMMRMNPDVVPRLTFDGGRTWTPAELNLDGVLAHRPEERTESLYCDLAGCHSSVTTSVEIDLRWGAPPEMPVAALARSAPLQAPSSAFEWLNGISCSEGQANLVPVEFSVKSKGESLVASMGDVRARLLTHGFGEDSKPTKSVLFAWEGHDAQGDYHSETSQLTAMTAWQSVKSIWAARVVDATRTRAIVRVCMDAFEDTEPGDLDPPGDGTDGTELRTESVQKCRLLDAKPGEPVQVVMNAAGSEWYTPDSPVLGWLRSSTEPLIWVADGSNRFYRLDASAKLAEWPTTPIRAYSTAVGIELLPAGVRVVQNLSDVNETLFIQAQKGAAGSSVLQVPPHMAFHVSGVCKGPVAQSSVILMGRANDDVAGELGSYLRVTYELLAPGDYCVRTVEVAQEFPAMPTGKFEWGVWHAAPDGTLHGTAGYTSDVVCRVALSPK